MMRRLGMGVLECLRLGGMGLGLGRGMPVSWRVVFWRVEGPG